MLRPHGSLLAERAPVPHSVLASECQQEYVETMGSPPEPMEDPEGMSAQESRPCSEARPELECKRPQRARFSEDTMREIASLLSALPKTTPLFGARRPRMSHKPKKQAVSNTGIVLALGVLGSLFLSRQTNSELPTKSEHQSVERHAFPTSLPISSHNPLQDISQNPLHNQEPHPLGNPLWFLANAGAIRINSGATETPIWHQIAELQLNSIDCATYWSTVSANIIAFYDAIADDFARHSSACGATPIEMSLLFRVISDNGELLGLRQIDYTAFAPSPILLKQIGSCLECNVRFPVAFQFFFQLPETHCSEPIRLQAALQNACAVEAVTIRDLQWATLAAGPK